MAPNKSDQETFRDYLLGRLAGEALESFEKRLLTEGEEFELLLASAEDELVDDYVAGQLTADERSAFEKHFLITAERQEDVLFARSLNTVMKRQAVGKTPPRMDLGVVLRAAAAVLVVAFVAFLAYRYIKSPQTFATIHLNPSIATRGEAPSSTKVSVGNVDALRIFLTVPENLRGGKGYRGELETGSGDKQSLNVVAKDSQTATVDIDASRLRQGSYALKLFVIDSNGTEQRVPGHYYFTVE